MKKMLLGTFLGMFAMAGIAILPNSVSAGDDSSRRTNQEEGAQEGSMTQQDKSYNPNVYGADKMRDDSLIQVIRKAINWVLGILSFVALVLCLWGGFQMMTSGGDSKKYEAGLNLLKWAAIGLAVIAVSWLVVSLVFYIIQGAAGEEGIPSTTTA